MAQLRYALSLGLVTTKGGDKEEVAFAEGSHVTVIKEWDKFWLVKDEDGHFYNIPKDALAGE